MKCSESSSCVPMDTSKSTRHVCGAVFLHALSPSFGWSGWWGGKNTGVGCHSLLQEIFLTQGLNPGLKKIIQSPTSLVAQMVKCLSTMQETWVQSLGREDPLEKEMAIHSSTIAWKIPWTEEPGRLQSMGSQRVRHD